MGSISLPKQVGAYSAEQISAYEAHISLPERFRKSNSPALTIEYLTTLHIHQITAAPYENLNLHYSTHRSVNLDPQLLYDKIVTDKRGRGGYCMEVSILFSHMLKGLGFNTYPAGVRIRARTGGVPGGDYVGWVHMVNIVTLPTGEKYALDVGFGGDGPTLPLPLDPKIISTNLGSQQVRLHYDNLPHQTTNFEQKYWIYQYRNSLAQEWNSFYAFCEFEFFPADFDVMSCYTSSSETVRGSRNFQLTTAIVVRFLREGEKVIGKVMLVNGEVKRNLGGKTVLEKVCTTEEERVRVLKEVFDITLTEEEAASITGRETELGVTPKII